MASPPHPTSAPTMLSTPAKLASRSMIRQIIQATIGFSLGSHLSPSSQISAFLPSSSLWHLTSPLSLFRAVVPVQVKQAIIVFLGTGFDHFPTSVRSVWECARCSNNILFFIEYHYRGLLVNHSLSSDRDRATSDGLLHRALTHHYIGFQQLPLDDPSRCTRCFLGFNTQLPAYWNGRCCADLGYYQVHPVEYVVINAVNLSQKAIPNNFLAFKLQSTQVLLGFLRKTALQYVFRTTYAGYGF